MTTKTSNPEMESAQRTLVDEAYNQLTRQLELLGLQVAMESGPYRFAAADFAKVANRTRENVERMSDAARLLSDLTQPVDRSLIKLRQLSDRLRDQIVVPLQTAAQQNEASARAAIRNVGESISAILKDCASHGTTKTAADKVIVVVDLANYSSLVSTLQDDSGVEAVSELNEHILLIIREALSQIGEAPENTLVSSTGDGAVLVFNKPGQAHRFAERLYRLVNEVNGERPSDVQLHFRIGVSAGEVMVVRPATGGLEVAGFPFNVAARLEAASRPGEVLMSEHTWEKLPTRIRRLYGESELIAGKRNERMAARRCHFVTAPVAEAT